MAVVARRRAIALIDYDNAKDDSSVAERNLGDVQFGCISIVSALLDALEAGLANYNEIRARFYGGWVHEDGRWTQRGDWMREELRSLRGLHRGVRLLPELAVALISQPARNLRGTARIRTDRSGYSFHQKMVDTMLCIDLLMIQLAPDEDLIVVSDDDDVVPALIAAQPIHERIHLLRNREAGKSCNDHHLADLEVSIALLRPKP